MAHTRIKICGIRTREAALWAAEAGADAIGLLFWPQSVRAVSVAEAAEVAAVLPPFLTRVGVFVDPAPAQVEEALAGVHLDLLQFHGAESAEQCGRYGLPYLKALQVTAGTDLRGAAASYGDAQGLLLDAFHPALPGGSGATFDWDLIPSDLGVAVVLAGGLTPDNVAAAICRVRPWAVDVSGGVESSRGVKDAARIAAFVNEVRRVESDQRTT